MENQKIQLIKKQESFSLVVEENLEKIIRILCDKLPHNEYSGTLFYTITGSIEKGDLTIHAKDFYLQDIGEGAYTEFQNDASLAGYMAEHELWDCYTGLMHSHNSFSAFFSGTDTNTLQSEGSEQNHFVSLIVNNEGKYCAAITRRIKTSFVVEMNGTKEESYPTWNNEVKTNVTPYHDTQKKETEYIEYFNLVVTVAPYKFEKNELDARVDELRNSTKSYINKHKSFNSFISSAAEDYTSYKDIITSNPKTTKKPLYEKPKYIEANLFSKKELDDALEESTIDYVNNHINKDMIKKHVAQIITGDIFAHYKKIDLNKWAENMKSLYDKRFPTDEDVEAFNMYAEAVVELLSSEVACTDIAAAQGLDFALAIWANDLVGELSSYSINPYLDSYIEIITRWII